MFKINLKKFLVIISLLNVSLLKTFEVSQERKLQFKKNLKNQLNPYLISVLSEIVVEYAVPTDNQIKEATENIYKAIQTISFSSTMPDKIALLEHLKKCIDNGAEADSDRMNSSLYVLYKSFSYCGDGELFIKIQTLLLNNGADINSQRNYFKITPLMLAANSGKIESIRFLLEHGADKHIRPLSKLTNLV